MEPLDVSGTSRARSDAQVRAHPAVGVRMVRIAPLTLLMASMGFAVAVVATRRFELLTVVGVLWPPLFVTGVLVLLIGPSDTLVVDRVGCAALRRKHRCHLPWEQVARLEQPALGPRGGRGCLGAVAFACAYRAVADWLGHARRMGWLEGVELSERALNPPEVDSSGHGVRRDHLVAMVR